MELLNRYGFPGVPVVWQLFALPFATSGVRYAAVASLFLRVPQKRHSGEK